MNKTYRTAETMEPDARGASEIESVCARGTLPLHKVRK